MATFYKCDGCGEETQRHEELGKVSMPHMDYHQQGFSEGNEGYTKEYCAKCVRTVKSVIDSLGAKK